MCAYSLPKCHYCELCCLNDNISLFLFVHRTKNRRCNFCKRQLIWFVSIQHPLSLCQFWIVFVAPSHSHSWSMELYVNINGFSVFHLLCLCGTLVTLGFCKIIHLHRWCSSVGHWEACGRQAFKNRGRIGTRSDKRVPPMSGWSRQQKGQTLLKC